MQPSGIIVLNKPGGITSRRALNHVARLVKPAKAGHAGTLDPIADGILVVGVGSATRLIRYVQQMGKRYRASFLLGCESPTDDVEADVVPLDRPPRPTAEAIETALPQFVGLIDQCPPAFSAIKIDGRRAYDLARSGNAPEMKPRQVRIDEIKIVKYEYPVLTIDIACGSGTYVRSLGRDLAKHLGTAAVMSALTRTAIGAFDLSSSIAPEHLTAELLVQRLLPPISAIDKMQLLVTDSPQQHELMFGRPIRCAIDPGVEEIAAVNSGGDLIAVLSPLGDGSWRPTCNFSHTLASPAREPE